MDWKELGSQAVLLLIFGFIAKHWFVTRMEGSIHHEYAKQLAKFSHEHAKKLAGISAKLDVLSSEEKFMFEQRHLKYIEVLSETYGRLWFAASMIKSYMNPGFGPDQYRACNEEVYDAWRSFYNYFNQNRLWIPKDAADMIEKIRTSLWEAVLIPYEVSVVDPLLAKEEKEKAEKAGEVWMGEPVNVDFQKSGEVRKNFENEILPAIAEVEINFRHRLDSEF